MKIRSKLLLSYTITLLAIIAVGVVSMFAVNQWQQAANEQETLRLQGASAERLRAAVDRVVNFSLDNLSGDGLNFEEFEQMKEIISGHLEELKTHSIKQDELDHIEGIEETEFELIWVISGIFDSKTKTSYKLNIPESSSRLREIAGEVADDVSVLNQYYRSQLKASMERATNAGSMAMLVIGIAIIIGFVHVLALMLLVRRWLVKPMADVTSALVAIGDGNLEVKLPSLANDEWGQLSQSVNELTLALKMAQHQLRSQERFATLGEAAAYTAHNIRNPLAAIRAAAQVTMQELNGREKDTTEALGDILVTVDRLDRWVNSFLSYSAPMELNKNMTSFNEIVTSAVSIAHEPQKYSECRITTRFAGSLPEVSVDSVQMEQALVAIITNALQAESKLVEVKTSVVMGPASRKQLLVIIKDDGKGVSKELSETLFQPFVTDKNTGTGLGLPQARKIVELHKGSLTLESSLGNGSMVTLTIPLSDNRTKRTHSLDEEILIRNNDEERNGTSFNS